MPQLPCLNGGRNHPNQNFLSVSLDNFVSIFCLTTALRVQEGSTDFADPH